MTSLPERCSNAEFERRYRLVREEMSTQGVDCLLVYGTYQGWGNVFYFSNHWDLVNCYLVLPSGDEPTLFTGTFPHLEIARREAVVKDVRFGGPQAVSMVAEELHRRGFSERVIGLVEPDSFRLPGIPYKDLHELKGRLPRASFVPATPMIEEIRRRKSEEEIEILRQAAVLTDNALIAAVDAIRPGMTERDLARVVRGSVGDPADILVGSTPMDDPTVPYPSIRPSSREFRRGDVILVEFCVGCAGYFGQILRTITLGPPTERYEELYALARRAYRDITAILRAGSSAEEVAEAGRFIVECGLTTGDPLVHGYGIGIEGGLHVGVKDHGAYWPPGKFTFPAGASVSVEPNPCSRDMRCGTVTGGLVIVRESGCEELQKVPWDRIIVK